MTGGPEPTQPSEPPQETRAKVRDALQDEVARVDTPAAAEAIADRLEREAAGKTEHQEAQQAQAAPVPAGERVAAARAAAGAAPVKTDEKTDEAAAVLLRTAETATAQTPEGAAVVEGAQDVLTKGAAPPPPEVERGRALLKEAVLRRMGPLQRLDARIYIAFNGIPHAGWIDRAANWITIWATGGWIWAGAVLVARLLGVRRARGAMIVLLPSVVAATWIVEHPVKAIFRRRRPFVDVVRALVVGKKPGSWSFPSGHTASSFAAAWVMSKRWPRLSPLFFALAALVGTSRVYVGAHYPGDVVSGAGAGVVISEAVYRLNRHLRRKVEDP
jgi:membrane-associated phospholipid phosphatase